ncbi:MAG: hypothetical protein NTW19_24960 [Planctomycetota bacterium]|nr:hypothetical protein [Planctomycetota bacterium]
MAASTSIIPLVASGDFGDVLVVLLVLAVAVASIYFSFVRPRQIFDNWVRENGLTIIEARRCIFSYGAFSFFTTGKGQTIYRFSARRADGQVVAGWARVGGFFLGAMSNRVEVRWEE